MIPSLLLLTLIALAVRIALLIIMVRWRRVEQFPFLSLFLFGSIIRTSVLVCYANSWKPYTKILNDTENAMNILLLAAAIECWWLLWRYERKAMFLATLGAALFAISMSGYMILAGRILKGYDAGWHAWMQIPIYGALAGFVGVVALRFLYWFEIGRALRSYAHGLYVLFAFTAVGYALVGIPGKTTARAGAVCILAATIAACVVWTLGMRGNRYAGKS